MDVQETVTQQGQTGSRLHRPRMSDIVWVVVLNIVPLVALLLGKTNVLAVALLFWAETFAVVLFDIYCMHRSQQFESANPASAVPGRWDWRSTGKQNPTFFLVLTCFWMFGFLLPLLGMIGDLPNFQPTGSGVPVVGDSPQPSLSLILFTVPIITAFLWAILVRLQAFLRERSTSKPTYSATLAAQIMLRLFGFPFFVFVGALLKDVVAVWAPVLLVVVIKSLGDLWTFRQGRTNTRTTIGSGPNPVPTQAVEP